jgi:hypothetical protein
VQLDQALADYARQLGAAKLRDPADLAWARATARLLSDREALAAALADKDAVPDVPPGMPIGSDAAY